MGFNGKGKEIVLRDNRIVFLSFDDKILVDYLFSLFCKCKCILSNSLEGLEVSSRTRWQETLTA